MNTHVHVLSVMCVHVHVRYVSSTSMDITSTYMYIPLLVCNTLDSGIIKPLHVL